MTYNPDLAAKLITTARYSAVARTGRDAATLGSWDPALLRGPRVLVPVDVQALVVGRSGDQEACVALPGPMTPGLAPDPADPAAAAGPPPFSAPATRPPGVHLHWAMPDGLLKTRIGTQTDGGLPSALTMPPLPDRWLVARLLAPVGGGPLVVNGSVVLAGTAQTLDLAGFTGTPPAATIAARQQLQPAALTGIAGGSLSWTAGYDTAQGRFTLHDPLDDLVADPTLGGTLPGGPAPSADRPSATYVVVGWWTDPTGDPLDGIREGGGLAEALLGLGWALPPAPAATGHQPVESTLAQVRALGLQVAERDGSQQQPESEARLAGLIGHDDAKVLRSKVRLSPSASTLLHGALVSVPVDGGSPATRDLPDLRPAASAVSAVFAHTSAQTVAALAAAAVAGVDAGEDARIAAERLLFAFTAGQLRGLGQPDGVADLDDRRHTAGFASRVKPDEPGIVDRLRTHAATVPDRPPRPGSSANSTATGAVDPRAALMFARSKPAGLRFIQEAAALTRSRALESALGPGGSLGTAAGNRPPATATADPGRTVTRPAPPYVQPVDPALTVAGAGRSQRFGGDGRFTADGSLRVRMPADVAQNWSGLLPGSAILASLGSGAVPDEALLLAREAALLSPDWTGYLAAESSRRTGVDQGAVLHRLTAEMALRYDTSGAYVHGIGLAAVRTADSAPSRVGARGDGDPRLNVVDELLRGHSLLDGVEPSPVAVTSWAQPWVPLWLEWEVTVDSTDPLGSQEPLAGWQLGPVDLDPVTPDPGGGQAPPILGRTVVASGRSHLSASSAAALNTAVTGWLREEDERDSRGVGELDEDAEARLAALAAHVSSLDLVAATLDGVLDTLLATPGASARTRDASGNLRAPHPIGLPLLLAAGRVRLSRARLIDAFGRFLDLDPATVSVPGGDAPDAVPGTDIPAASLLLRPRLSRPSRLRLAFVDSAAGDAVAAVDARVDEIDSGQQVNPVAGFLLPNHVDESIEVFDVDGNALGELLPTRLGPGLVWEPAPGRPLPPDAAPGTALDTGQQILGQFAAGLLSADTTARASASQRAESPTSPGGPETALSALLRAIDTTLWSTDPVSAAGTSEVGGIVGRPVAVVRCVLSLDVWDDVSDPTLLDLDDEGRSARAAAYAALARVGVPVRIGSLIRSDDGVLGFFVDDDFTKVHLVDSTVAELARVSGRLRGHLGPYGVPADPGAVVTLTHPYLVPDGIVKLRPGVPRLITLLLMPGAAASVTCGVLPRIAVRLQRAWFGDGLDRLSPTIRVGPLLIDPGEVRLPHVAALAKGQVFSRRSGPLTWRDDPILAASQAAFLPDTPTTAQEGWIRVVPGSSGPPA